MRAMRLHELGGPEAFRLDEGPAPHAGAGDVRIRVHAVGLNYTDLAQRAGRLPGASPLPFTAGVEIAGVVDEIGDGVEGIALGARVVAVLPMGGGLAEHAVAPAANVTPISERIAFEQAVALPVQAPTALLLVRRAAEVREGRSIFVPGAAGGVGSLVVQLAKKHGARVLASSEHVGARSQTRDAQRELVRRLGADVLVDTTRAEWPEQVREATGGRGADAVLVSGGDAAIGPSVRALAPGGRLVLFGADTMLGAQLTREQLMSLMVQNQTVVGLATFTLPQTELRGALQEVLSLVERGAIEPVVVNTFALEEVPAAHRAMDAGQTSGKVVIRVTNADASTR